MEIAVKVGAGYLCSLRHSTAGGLLFSENIVVNYLVVFQRHSTIATISRALINVFVG